MLGWALNLGFAASGTAPVTVPDVTGETQAQATLDLTALGLAISPTNAYSSVVAAGLVISQSPVGGSLVAPGATVAITVSLGDVPAPPAQEFSGGFLYEYERHSAARRRKRKEQEDLEEQSRALQDQVDREIAELLRLQEARDAERDNLDRLQRLVQKYSKDALELSDRAKIAYVRVLTQANFSALEALDRELQRMIEEEEVTALMILLNED